jgi:hypothetical protein
MGNIRLAVVVLGFELLAMTAAAEETNAPKTDSATVKSETVVIVSAEHSSSCSETTPERARRIADQAFRDGDYQLAGSCYLVAGEPALADQAFVKGIGQSSADTSRQLTANLAEVKAQVRQMKTAFHRR